MTSLAIIHRESDPQVTNATKLFLENISHLKMFGRFFLNIENIRVTTPAVQPSDMNVMGKERWRNVGPLSS